MDRQRRRCLHGLVAGAALAALPAAGTGASARGSVRLDVREFGARGDGQGDDTRAFQAAIDALPEAGGTVVVPAGNYPIDPLRSLRLRSRMHFSMAADTRLVAMSNAAPRAYVLLLQQLDDVEVSGGRIIGDRERHLGTTGEWGHGIMVRGSSRIRLHDLYITRCWGDGISVGGLSGVRGQPPLPSRDVLIQDVVCQGNRRQGLTIGRSRHVRVLRSSFLDTGGVLPGCGIDIEPDPGGDARDVLIEDCLVQGNQGAGIQLYERVHDVTVRRCRILSNRGDGLHLRAATGGLIEGNEIRGNGLRGITVRARSSGFRLRDNQLRGNAAQVAKRSGKEAGWMNLDVARGASSIQIDPSSRPGR
ncbi:right-handed parallel beta-helix repeat-containing protein [Pseudoxanthomonas sp. PXM04]|uniref:right-handed parallel beta-helix repeat-containing protein n=1 Tax=Pseudoxanthomonas sp. PXM04 TaxID=2769297 RepID=UPI0017867E98|nr:right-handed parallel beta-helix repeat-containing protein [Pseudoxanthomonas sp. PXM04]MBD9377987.1 right-handed parallel beta-helix repeat-containing protein [Pseudoxanthomonas sp. PXM04]